MLQHMMLSYFLPPLALLATPEWLLRVLVGDGRAYAVLRWFCHPVVAGVLFNVAVMVTHIPGVVNASVQHGPLHYLVHVMVVDDGAADVDAGVRSVPGVPHEHRRQDDLPVPDVGRSDRAGGMADVRRRGRVQGVRPAGAGVGASRSPPTSSSPGRS